MNGRNKMKKMVVSFVLPLYAPVPWPCQDDNAATCFVKEVTIKTLRPCNDVMIDFLPIEHNIL